MSKSTLKILPALMVAITAAFMTQPVFGVPDHQLVITENSSSSLSVTYDASATGITVVLTAADHWTISFTQLLAFNTGNVITWFEPANPNRINVVGQGLIGTLLVDSDLSFSSLSPPSDGFTYVNVGVDDTNGGAFDVTFHDHGDVAAGIPDTGPTWMLLLLGVTATFGLNVVFKKTGSLA